LQPFGWASFFSKEKIQGMGITTFDAPNNWIVYDHIDFNSISSVVIVPLQQPNYLLFPLARQPPVGQGLVIHEVSRTHKTTHHSL
jgi:hypothetical protein